MEFVYKILCVLAFNTSFCFLVVNLRLILESYLTLKLNTMLEEKRIDHKATLILAREQQRPWRELEE